MFILLGVNILFQIICLFTGWMIVINDDNSYSHGKLYNLYVALYFVIIILVIIEFMIYGRKFRKQNVASLYASLGLVIVGILFQEILGREVRLAYISLTMGLALLFIHNSEFAQLELDDRFYEQKIKILEDPLTTLYSHYAYNTAIEEMRTFKFLANDLVVFLIDVNELKATNDRLGHSAGDELIRGAANCIYAAFSHYGKCYRIGGDEFVVIANISEDAIDEQMALLNDLTSKWQSGKGIELTLSVGYAKASDNINSNIEELVNLADENMYKEKAEYYDDKKENPIEDK
jgi:diguanylate cyclase (GGDEF)-like protein